MQGNRLEQIKEDRAVNKDAQPPAKVDDMNPLSAHVQADFRSVVGGESLSAQSSAAPDGGSGGGNIPDAAGRPNG
jgi:hypothetical protein